MTTNRKTSIWDRIKTRWNRVFAQKQPMPWEERDSAIMLRNLSRDPWACKMLADALELDIDPGESAADYLAQAAEQVYREVKIKTKEREIAKLRAGSYP